MKSILISFLRKQFGIEISRSGEQERTGKDLRRLKRIRHDYDFIRAMPTNMAQKILEHMDASKGQLRQDLFALSQLGFKKNGFFVEFGATNGLNLSNTHLLETAFGWTGIVAEPARTWHDALKQNRSCSIETKCVWKESGATLTFNEVDYAELSTISSYSETDGHKERRKHGKTYQVDTISLNDLLEKHSAPTQIDYLSIDTEGSEYDILSHFDFSRYRFKVITCEHNFTPMREKLHTLLSGNGYVRVHEKLSRFDDWYIHPAALEQGQLDGRATVRPSNIGSVNSRTHEMKSLLHPLRGVAPDILKDNRHTRSRAFVQYLCLAMTPDHAQAKHSVEWAETCLRDWRAQRAEPDWGRLETEGKAKFILTLIERIADDLCEKHSGDVPWLIGFSSGLDSRLLHYALRKSGVALQPYTYGQPGNLDFDFSKRAAEHLGLETIFFDTTQLSWSLELVDKMTSTARDRPTSPRAICAHELLSRTGKPFVDIHGFLNDRLTGVALPPSRSTDWASTVAHELKLSDQFGFQSFVRPDVLGSFFSSKPLSEALPYDQQIGIGYRQFQRIRPGDIDGVTYLCPYTDPRWVGFWLNRAFDELSGQRLYVESLLISHIPEFFDLNQLADEGRDTSKKARLELMYGNGKKRREFAQSQGVQAPIAATSHFCAYACYRNNPSFARYADQSLSRLRARKLFHDSFIDDVSRRFKDGDKLAENMVKGFLSIDSCMEMKLLS